MKKLFVLALIGVFALGFVGCTTTLTGSSTTTTTTTISDQEIVDAVYAGLDLGTLTALTNASERLILPVLRDGVTITWNISDLDAITAAGVIIQPEHEIGDLTVTLTATLVLNSVTVDKVFTATVLALPAPEDAVPLLDETFESYNNGDITSQLGGAWAPVSGKTGNSQFFVVGSVIGTTIPESSKALRINAYTELQIEAALVHTLPLVIVEADFYQTANGSPIYVQTSSSSPVIGFGLMGGGSSTGSIFYRTDNGTMIETEIPLNTWIKLRLEVNLTNKTIELFYYDSEEHLISATPGPVPYTGSTTLPKLFIRSGSSTTPSLNPNPAYITNILVNRIEAMPRPVDPIKLGTISGISPTLSVENGSIFSPEEPVVKGYYGGKATLIKDTDYSLTITNPVNTTLAGEYTVVYTITNLHDSLDIKTVDQTVTVFSSTQPNVISSATATMAVALTHLTNVTVVAQRPEGVLHYVLSETVLSSAEILASGSKISQTLTQTTTVLENIAVQPNQKIYFVIELNGSSNVLECDVTHQPVVLITTPEEFYAAVTLSTGEQQGKYFLIQNDLDFTAYTWVSTNNEFVAELDGQGFKISNLTITKNAMCGGIFSKVTGATIKNLVLDHVITHGDQSGSALLAGESRGTVLFENIVVVNSTNTVECNLADYASDTTKAASYGAMIVGRIRGGALTLRNISVYDSTVESFHNYGGGLVAGMEIGTSAIFQDIYLENFTVKEATDLVTVSGQMVGGIIGRVQGNVTIERVVILNISVTGRKNVGGLIGKSDEPGVTVLIKDVYVDGTISFTSSTHSNSLVGNIADHTPTLENVWASGFATIADTGGLAPIEGNLINHTLTEVESWWTTNIPNILISPLWDYDVSSPILLNLQTEKLPELEVILDYNITLENGLVLITQGDEFSFTPPEVAGFIFIGWFSDLELLTPLPVDYIITVATTVYGKYDPVPASTVTFDSGVGGPAVPSQSINYGNLATLPLVAETMFTGVLKKVTGWLLDGVPFAFTTPITENITLTAVWETCTYLVSFEDGTSQTVEYGELALKPETDPLHPAFSSITFNAWTSGGVVYNFATPVTAELTLKYSWTVPALVEITTQDQFHFMATNETDYDYALMNDLNFSGYSWIATGKSFKGTFEGNGHMIYNLTVAVTGGTIKGGIFSFLQNATIKNVIFQNITTSGDASASGMITGEIRGATTLEDIVIMNSSNFVSNQYVGLIAGRIRSLLVSEIETTDVVLKNISIVDTTSEGTNTYGGGLVAGMDSGTSVTFQDIYMRNVTIEESSALTTGGEMVGGIIGRVKGTVVMERLVLINVNVVGLKNIGGLIGKAETGGITTITDVYLNGEVTSNLATPSTYTNIITGYIYTESTPTLTTVFASGFANASTNGQGVIPANLIVHTEVLVEAWWTTNIPNILAQTTLWDFDTTSTLPVLLNLQSVPPLE